MKLQYLKQVQELFENYDFQDKYKILLDLENFITKQEQKEGYQPEIITQKLGTPEQFVERVAKKYNLTMLDNTEGQTSSASNTEELLSVTNTEVKKTEIDENITLEMEPVTTDDVEPQTIKPTNDEKIKKQHFNNPLKKPVAILFKIISTLFYIFSLLVTTLAIIAAVAMLLMIDIQTAISFFLGILLAISAGLLTLNAIKNFIFGMLDNNLNIAMIVIKIIIVIACVVLANILVSTSIEKVTLYVTSNISLVQDFLSNLGIDFNSAEIDWNSIGLGDYTELGIEIIKSYLIK